MKLIVHSFFLEDVEEPDPYLAKEIDRWLRTKHGKWCKQYFKDLTYRCVNDYARCGHHVSIIGKIDEGPLLTEYLLRWNNKKY